MRQGMNKMLIQVYTLYDKCNSVQMPPAFSAVYSSLAVLHWCASIGASHVLLNNCLHSTGALAAVRPLWLCHIRHIRQMDRIRYHQPSSNYKCKTLLVLFSLAF